MLQLLLHHFHIFLDLLLGNQLQLTSSFLFLRYLLQLVVLRFQISMLNNQQMAFHKQQYTHISF